MNSKKIKVLIVEDSMTDQELLRYIIESDPMLEVVGVAKDGVEALESVAKNRPDVITMDVFMPRMDGFEATRQIMSTTPIPILIISAKYQPSDVEFSFKAVECGALTVMEKPKGPADPDFEEISTNIVKTLKTISHLSLITRRFNSAQKKASSEKHTPPLPPPNVNKNIRAVAIGASLGGPVALKELLSNISPDCPVPIFLVQHIIEGFVQGFADWLREFSKLPIVIPTNGEHILPGHVYLAPDGLDMIVQKNQLICLSNEVNDKINKPSVAKLFESIISTYRHQAVGILLTGMGDDGSKELLKMREVGALTIAQDQNTSLVFGMPGKAIEIGAASYVLAIEQIAPFLNACLLKTSSN